MTTALRRLTVLTNQLRPTPTSATAALRFNTAKLGSSFSTTSPIMSSQVKQLVDKTIAENKVVVFSKSYCPYCKKAKTYLAEDTDDIKILELDERDDGSAIQAYLKELNGQGTVPHVYLNQEFIGGSSDLLKLSHQQVKQKISA